MLAFFNSIVNGLKILTYIASLYRLQLTCIGFIDFGVVIVSVLLKAILYIKFKSDISLPDAYI